MGIDDLRSKREEVVLCHIDAALITLLLPGFLGAEAAAWGGIDVDTLVPRRVTAAIMAAAVLLMRVVVTQVRGGWNSRWSTFSRRSRVAR